MSQRTSWSSAKVKPSEKDKKGDSLGRSTGAKIGRSSSTSSHSSAGSSKDRSEELDRHSDFDEEEEKEVGLKEIPQILLKIPDIYHRPNYNPRPMVVSILRGGNTEKEMKVLEGYANQLDVAMNAIVDLYYQGFNFSIRSYTKIMECVTNSQSIEDNLSVSSEKEKTFLYSHKTDLRDM